MFGNLRRPAATVRRLHDLRLQYSRWGREKLRMLFRREGIMLSAKTIDRVLARLRATGQLVEPPAPGHLCVSPSARSSLCRPQPRDYGVAAPGELVQVDTLDVRPRPGVTFKQFTAREVVSHWDRMETYRRTRRQTHCPRTHTEEFYELYTGELDQSTVRSTQRKWEYTSNYIRPHHALGYLSPAEFLAHHAAHRPPSHMS